MYILFRKCSIISRILLYIILPMLTMIVRKNDTIIINVPDHLNLGGKREGIQPHPSPFEICVDKKRIKQGDNMTVTIRGRKNDVAFKGFFIYAVNSTNMTVGSFHPSPDIEILDSAYRKQGAARQRTFSEKEKLQLTWIAPTDFLGPIRFLMSIMKTVAEIWIAELSEEVMVI